MLELSHHSVAMMHTCPKKFYWYYIAGLDPITRSTQLTLGTVMHEAFDRLYKGDMDSAISKFVYDRFQEEIKKTELIDQEDMRVAQYIAVGMWNHFPHKNINEFEERFSEEEFQVKISPDVVFVGRVDGRVKKTGVWWIRELKTTALPFAQFQGRASVSPQATGYVYGMAKLGIDARGLIYDYIKKPLLRKGTTENVDGYGRRIVKDYHDRPKFYYSRHFAFRTPVDLRHFEDDLTMMADEIKQRCDTGRFPRNQDACFSFGSECPYAKICFAEKPDALTLELYYNKKESKYGRGSKAGNAGSEEGTHPQRRD